MINENTKRLITSLLFVPIVIFSIFYEGHNTLRYFFFFLLILITSVLISKELISIANSKGIRSHKIITITTIILTITITYILNLPNTFIQPLNYPLLNYTAMFIFCILASSFLIFLKEAIQSNFQTTLETVAMHIFIVFYAAIGIIFLLKLQHTNHWHLLFLWVVTWATDSGAYFIGKYFGKIKLNLKVSPNKTLEGFIGGILIGIVAAILLKLIFAHIYNYQFSPIYSFPYIILITIAFTILTIFGDITESVIKRSGGIKDSNNYIPGHGGMLDVMDSLLYNSPIFYFILSFSI